ncbi:PREDICTED: arginine-glutamic acid dipeptide repeats protein-like [Papilio polytes]|uniref:arginine-glutamic acid dipeptide repeats protein-like n=1 Tax=Papilio polytes TaxID=76194 RepID=UPI0006765615|nr:PREDICTED: arginine-glutamic acid dipeptide repeats protein-like [Papilio polytes]
MSNFKDSKNKSALSTRWAQMSKQEQIIERKKIEIQAKVEAQKQAAALAAQVKLNNSSNQDDKSGNIFSNDGSFMSQYKALLEQQKLDKEKIEQEKIEEEEKLKEIEPNIKSEARQVKDENDEDNRDVCNDDSDEDISNEKPRDTQKRWNNRGRNSPTTPVVEDRKKVIEKQIPPLMNMPVRSQDTHASNSHKQWNSYGGSDTESETNSEDKKASPKDSVSAQSGPGTMGQGPIGLGSMGPGAVHLGPQHMGPRLMGPGPMGPGPMGHGPMGPGPMGPNMDAMGPGPMCPMRPHGPGPMNMGPNMSPGPRLNMGHGLRPMNGPGRPNMPPMPPFFGGPPNCPMPPNFMGPNGPRGHCGPGGMPPNMCGPNMRGLGPNGPMPPFFGPPFPNPGMMGPNGPPNPMMPPNSMPYMGSPPFGPNGPNFRNNRPPFGPNGPPNMPFMPPTSMPPNSLHTIPEPKPLDALCIPHPESMKLQNIPPPRVLPLNHIPKRKELDSENASTGPKSSQVLSADVLPAAAQRAAAEVASNGDHWENVLKAIHIQDHLWFLHNTNSNEYKAFRELVMKLRKEAGDDKSQVKPEDRYEPEFCLEDDDSYDESKPIKQEACDGSDSKQDDGEPNGKEAEAHRRERKRKSRWGEDPPADIKPPGIAPPLPPMLPGAKLAKIDEEGMKLTNIHRSNPALMQYAMTNYGTTNLSADDWKKCEDNFKLNLLYQDMLKKRQEVDRLAAAGKNKYEYDSDEDTSEGTWEHRLRAKEMCATEKWATELTKQAAGKHHIGDFLPPEELRKFMEKYSAIKSGKEPDLSDYKEFKLKEDNIGFKMLQKLGWNEGQGLGAEGGGIVEPINKAPQPVANLGLGAAAAEVVNSEDDEFDAYRKRMMLAYRFRPNPLNNPRRPYY